MDVSVRELKARLSEYLRRVESGEELRITNRGRVVARMTSVTANGPQDVTAAQLMERLRRIPGIRPGRGGKPRGAEHPLPTRPGQRTLSEIVLEDRD